MSRNRMGPEVAGTLALLPGETIEPDQNLFNYSINLTNIRKDQ